MEDRKYFNAGDTFGDYTILKLLGKGGMGAVYLAKLPHSEELVAIKVMVPPEGERHEWRKRFAREASFAMRIRHKNLIAVHDVGEDPDTGYCYIIMDYVPGGSLSERIRSRGKLNIRESVEITIRIAAALEVAHKAGVVHRDIKPDNILFDSDGTPKLSDLGVAKFSGDEAETTITKSGVIVGTPAYMSPEQMMNSHTADARSDIYSLGVVFYEMLTGSRPNADSTIVQLLAKAINGEELPDIRTVRPEVSAALAYALSRMVAVKPESRPSSAYEVATLLYDAATGKLIVARTQREIEAERLHRKKALASIVKWGGACIGGGAFVALIALASHGLHSAGNRTEGGDGGVVTNIVKVVVTNEIERTESQVVTNVIERIVTDKGRLVETAADTGNAKPASAPPECREVPLHSVPESLRNDLERLRKRYEDISSTGRLAFGRLEVEGGSVSDVATYAWLNNDGTFSAGAIRAARNGILFLKHGYEPLIVRVDKANVPWNGDVALDVGTVTLKKLPPNKTASLILTPKLPKGVQSGIFTLILCNGSPCGTDWGTLGRERTSCVVKSITFRDGERISIDGCSPTTYTFTIDATGCQSFPSGSVTLTPGTNDLGKLQVLLAKTAKFAIRNYGDKGGDWKRLTVNVDGKTPLKIEGMKDKWGNTYRIHLNAYSADAEDSLAGHFGFSPNTFDEMGQMTIAKYERLEKSRNPPQAVSSRNSTTIMLRPGHIYRHRNDHWGCDMLIAFEEYAMAEAPSPVDSSKWRQGPTPAWFVEYEKALAEAKRTNKPLFALSTGSDWCSWCKRLRANVLDKPKFADFAANNLVLLYLDNPHRDPLCDEQKNHNSKVASLLGLGGGVPSAGLFAGDGQKLGSIGGGSYTLEQYIEKLTSLMDEAGYQIANGKPHADANATGAADSEADSEADIARLLNADERIYTAMEHGYKWMYRLDSKGGAILTSGGDAPCISPRPVGKLTVPSRIGRHNVVAIGDKAFFECDKMTDIVLPEGIEGIVGWHSFTRCTKLKSVKLPMSLRFVGGWSFESCNALRNFNFGQCRKANVRDHATTEDYEFFGCVFTYNRNLSSMTVSRDNPTLTSVDGVLYSKDKKTLLAFPKSRKSFSIVPGVKKIAGCALSSCSLRNVKIPEGVEEIGNNAFEYNDGYLKSVEFPKSLKKIGHVLFQDTHSLQKVVFHGNAPEFIGAPMGWNSADFIIEVERGSKGWNGPDSTDLPDRWPVGAGADSRRIRYIR